MIFSLLAMIVINKGRYTKGDRYEIHLDMFNLFCERSAPPSQNFRVPALLSDNVAFGEMSQAIPVDVIRGEML